MEGWFLNSLIISRFKPLLEHSEFTFQLKFINEFWDWTYSDRIEKLFNVDFIAVDLKQSSKYFWGGILIHFEEINFNEFVLLVCIQVPGKLIDIVMHVTKINQRSWVW